MGQAMPLAVRASRCTTRVTAGRRHALCTDGTGALVREPERDCCSAQVRSLGSQVRLDARTKLLNPKWYEGMLSSGYEGVREIQKRLTNTVGWSATSGAVDNWVYDEVRLLLPC